MGMAACGMGPVKTRAATERKDSPLSRLQARAGPASFF